MGNITGIGRKTTNSTTNSPVNKKLNLSNDSIDDGNQIQTNKSEIEYNIETSPSKGIEKKSIEGNENKISEEEENLNILDNQVKEKLLEHTSFNETFNANVLPDIVNVQPVLVGNSADDSLITSLSKNLNNLQINTPKNKTNLPLPKSIATTYDGLSAVSSDDEFFSECQEFNETQEVCDSASSTLNKFDESTHWQSVLSSVTSNEDNFDITLEQVETSSYIGNSSGEVTSTGSTTATSRSYDTIDIKSFGQQSIQSSANISSEITSNSNDELLNKTLELNIVPSAILKTPENNINTKQVPEENDKKPNDQIQPIINVIEPQQQTQNTDKNLIENLQLENITSTKNNNLNESKESSINLNKTVNIESNNNTDSKSIQDIEKSPVNILNQTFETTSLERIQSQELLAGAGGGPNEPRTLNETLNISSNKNFTIEPLERIQSQELLAGTGGGTNEPRTLNETLIISSNKNFTIEPLERIQSQELLAGADGEPNEQRNLNETLNISSNKNFTNETLNQTKDIIITSPEKPDENLNEINNSKIIPVDKISLQNNDFKSIFIKPKEKHDEFNEIIKKTNDIVEPMDIDEAPPSPISLQSIIQNNSNKIMNNNNNNISVIRQSPPAKGKDVFVEDFVASNIDVKFKIPEIPTQIGGLGGGGYMNKRRSQENNQPEISDDEFQSKGLILTSSDFDFLLSKGNNNVSIDRSSLLLRFDPLLGYPVPSEQPTENKILNRLSPALEEENLSISEEEKCSDIIVSTKVDGNWKNSTEKKLINIPNVNSTILSEKFNDKTELKIQNNLNQQRCSEASDTIHQSSLSSKPILKSNSIKFEPKEKLGDVKMSVDVIQDMKIENDVKSIDNIKSESDEKQNYKMAEIEKKMKNESLKTEDIEKKLKDAEQREEALLKRITEKDKTIAKMSGVIEAYEKAIAELIADKEQIIQNYEKQMEEIKSDRDLNYQHLTSLETTFSDLHAKYERSKQLTANVKASEESLLAEKKENLENLRLQEQRYEKMKNHAMQQLEIANNKLESLTKNHSIELTKLKALLKKEEISRLSTNEQLQQKARENEELMKICDELINNQGS